VTVTDREAPTGPPLMGVKLTALWQPPLLLGTKTAQSPGLSVWLPWKLMVVGVPCTAVTLKLGVEVVAPEAPGAPEAPAPEAPAPEVPVPACLTRSSMFGGSEGGGAGGADGGDCGGGDGGGESGGAFRTVTVVCAKRKKSDACGVPPAKPPEAASARHNTYVSELQPLSVTITDGTASSAPPAEAPALAAFWQPPSDSGTKTAQSPGVRGWAPLNLMVVAVS